jgi:phage terminase large subunit-like protein
MLQITTQSKEVPHGQFRRELQRARAQRDGTADHGMLAVLYELPPELSEKGAWRDQATWALVNPNLGRSVSLEFLRREMAKAEDDGADALALHASQHLNVEIGLGLHSDRWVGADLWPDCREDGLTLEAILASSDVAVIGIDGGGRDDLLGLSIIGRHRRTRIWQLWCRRSGGSRWRPSCTSSAGPET